MGTGNPKQATAARPAATPVGNEDVKRIIARTHTVTINDDGTEYNVGLKPLMIKHIPEAAHTAIALSDVIKLIDWSAIGQAVEQARSKVRAAAAEKAGAAIAAAAEQASVRGAIKGVIIRDIAKLGADAQQLLQTSLLPLLQKHVDHEFSEAGWEVFVELLAEWFGITFVNVGRVRPLVESIDRLMGRMTGRSVGLWSQLSTSWSDADTTNGKSGTNGPTPSSSSSESPQPIESTSSSSPALDL